MNYEAAKTIDIKLRHIVHAFIAAAALYITAPADQLKLDQLVDTNAALARQMGLDTTGNSLIPSPNLPDTLQTIALRLSPKARQRKRVI